MKKLFTLTIMLITLAMNAQDYAHVSNPVVRCCQFSKAQTRMAGKCINSSRWLFCNYYGIYEIGSWWWTFPEESQFQRTLFLGKTALPEGYKFYSFNNNDDHHDIVYVHEYASTGSTFSYTEAELDNSVKLFPNPTTSEVALNSEKTYEIEVFDILGNKVMELVGNSINMEHLSNATYIVNALDVETQESLSYKVIKK